MEAKVPGVVHLDLLEHEMIPDSLFRLNEKRAAWIEDREWWYRKDFEVSSELTSKAEDAAGQFTLTLPFEAS